MKFFFFILLSLNFQNYLLPFAIRNTIVVFIFINDNYIINPENNPVIFQLGKLKLGKT